MNYAYLFAFDGNSYLSVEQLRKLQEKVLGNFKEIHPFVGASIETVTSHSNFCLWRLRKMFNSK